MSCPDPCADCRWDEECRRQSIAMRPRLGDMVAIKGDFRIDAFRVGVNVTERSWLDSVVLWLGWHDGKRHGCTWHRSELESKGWYEYGCSGYALLGPMGFKVIQVDKLGQWEGIRVIGRYSDAEEA